MNHVALFTEYIRNKNGQEQRSCMQLINLSLNVMHFLTEKVHCLEVYMKLNLNI